MALKRLIPCLLLKNQNLVKTVGFKNPKYIGNPINAIKIYNDKEVDEIIVLDIFASKEKKEINYALIKQFSDECFMPLAYGGGINSLEQAEKLFDLGIEKIIVNSLLLKSPDEVSKISNKFGVQSVVASIDIKKKLFKGIVPFHYDGLKMNKSLVDYGKFCQDIGCGEIMLYGADKDGTWSGYDSETTSLCVKSWDVPVIACGGAGSIKDIKEVLYTSNAAAAAVGNMAVYQKKDMGVLIGFPKRENIIQE